MHRIELKILKVLGKSSNELSTSSLVRDVFEEEYDRIESNLEHYEKSYVLRAKREKAQLHRKLLYHLNKLLENQHILVSSIKGKGEKYFILNEERKSEKYYEPEVKNIYDSISTMKGINMFGLEKYAENKIIRIYDYKRWTSRLNAIMIKPILDTVKMYQFLNELYSSVNDVIGIVEFEKIIDTQTSEDVNKFMRKINIDSTDFNKYVSIHIDVTKVTSSVKLASFIKHFVKLKPDNIKCVFGITKTLVRDKKRHFRDVIDLFYNEQFILNVQNMDLQKSPMFQGRAGIYTIRRTDWNKYRESDYSKTIGLSLSSASIAIDVKRLLDKVDDVDEMENLFIKIARALLEGLTEHRKVSDIIFSRINELNKPLQHKFFLRQYNYIRLWNYDSRHPNYEKFLMALEKGASRIKEFCKTEETIFKSCGIPINIKIVLSSAFKKFDKKMSKRNYKKVTIKSRGDLTSKEMKDHLEQRTGLENIFLCDRIRFFRSQDATIQQISDEVNILLENYQIPLFCYDFRERVGNLTLDSFFK